MTQSKDEEQRMFQIEIQVGSITWAPHIENQLSTGSEASKICASFQFLDYPPSEICQDAFCAECSHNDVKFKTGKMMMFALKRSDLVRFHKNFIINIRAVLMTLKADRFPFRTELATARMNISNDFSAILSACFQPHVQHPASKFINDEIDLINNLGEVMGVMNIFLRLSTFGDTIMGHLYADPNETSDILKVQQDVAAQALVTQTEVASCPKRYVQFLGQDKGPEFKEYRGRSEDSNMVAARLYKLDRKFHESKTQTQGKLNPCTDNRPQPIEPGSLLLRGGEVVQQPDPGFIKPSNATSVYYRLTSEEGALSQKQMLQYIPTPAEEPVPNVGPITGLPPDSKADMYILRVGKKKAGLAMKTHLEVELHTPKYVSRKKERIYKDTQYDKKDLVVPPVQPPK